MNTSTVTVTIPATTSNIGPGFDAFGIALQLTNKVTLRKEEHPMPLSSMVQEAAALFFSKTAITPFPFSIDIEGDIPSARGLGRSVTVRLGVLLALNKLTQNLLSRNDLYHLAVSLEGHADNASPALFGGFTIARAHHKPLCYQLSSELHFILLIPDFEVSTASARKLLPPMVSMEDAVANLANAAVIATAFATGKYELMRGAFQDRLHQPFREPLIPYLSEALKAAESVGALGGWLSGSGSTIAAIVEDEKIAQRVVSIFQEIAPAESSCIISKVNNEGATILE
jgi:homoserine kinase